jgi:putative acyl-CoA dehydrogenase
VFGAPLYEQPLMRSVLADLILESEAATALAMRLARAFESDAPSEATLRRALTSGAKFWVCKRGCELAAEAMEILGGNGYTEELTLARMVREMPVNSIWEGSGNIMCLDVLRAFGKSPATTEVLLRELSTARGQNRYFDAAFERFAAFAAARSGEALARRFVQIFVTLMQAQLLLGAAAGSAAARVVAEAFCATRLNPDAGWGAVFGAGGTGGASDALSDAGVLLERAFQE